MKTLPVAALILVTLAGGSATGGERVEVTRWFTVGTAKLSALDTFCADVELAAGLSAVVGFEFEFDYFEPVADSSWASDLQVFVTSPDGETYTIGGLSNQPQSDILWSFNGPGSDQPGHYGNDGNDIFLPWKQNPQSNGDFMVTLRNDWSGDQFANLYDLVRIRFYTVALDSCAGDIDLDASVGFNDLLLMLTAWGPCGACPEDLDEDGDVGFSDLLALLFAWGPCF